MGCDIHMFAEVRKNGKWESSGKVFKSRYYKPEIESKIDDDGYEHNAKYTYEPYEGRNYNLFAILADVRNGIGFAGCETGTGFVPICDPKGLPSDICDFVKQKAEYWHGDAHSHSFFTVKELLDYDWNQGTKLKGVVSLKEYEKCKKNNETPSHYSGGIWGGKIVTISEDVADEILAGKQFEELNGKEIYVDHYWDETYNDCASLFLEDTIPQLQALGNPEDVRIVFWFDN